MTAAETQTESPTFTDERGYVWDIESGECIASPVEPEFHVTNRDSADWVLAKIAEHEADSLACQARLEAIRRNIEHQLVNANRRGNYLRLRFGEELAAFARQSLADAGGKSKTLQLDHGKVSFRATKGTNKITDMGAAVEWAERQAPGIIRTVKSVTVSDLKPYLDVQLDLSAFVESTPPGENVHIETGVK